MMDRVSLVSLQVVWFKRDLRVVAHEALSRACEAGPTLCLYVIEPGLWQQGSSSHRQWLFVRESLQDLQRQLRRLGAHLHLAQGSVPEVLESLRLRHGPLTLHSHVETGNAWTFDRDKAVARWCREHHFRWHEYAQNGVTRPVARRAQSFPDHWERWVSFPLFSVPDQGRFIPPQPDLELPAWPAQMGPDPWPCPARQPGGRSEGLAVLGSFLNQRGQAYRGAISSPLTAESGCSRLSPYIAHGCLSLREVVQRTRKAQAQARPLPWKASLEAFATRLAWHCHFIQKLEDRPSMEHSPVLPVMAQLKRPFDQARFDAWRAGRTGWPLVDASMRYLHHHGWINFRMRAMLVSAATYSLSLPWQPVAQHLAQLFVDFEPGIHYPQVQMQSGTTAGTILRMYNPVTQAMNLDPEGQFVRRWVPELRGVSPAWIFEPWKMTAPLRQQAGWTEDHFYPSPLVDFAGVHQAAKAEMTRLRALPDVQGRSPISRPTVADQAAPKAHSQDAQLSLF